MVYRWYQYYAKFDFFKGYTLTHIAFLRPWPSHTNDLYLDAQYEIYNEGNLRLSGPISFGWTPWRYTTEIKKKGAGSHQIVASRGEDMGEWGGYNIPIIPGDYLSYWLYAEDDFLGRGFCLQLYFSDEYPCNWLYPKLPPPPPPTFSPIWQKQIGVI